MKPISAAYIFSGVADSLKVKGSGDLVSLAIDCIDSIAKIKNELSILGS